MTYVTIHKAKTELSKLIARVEAGEEITIARGKEPVAILSPARRKSQSKQFFGAGSFSELKGKIPNAAFFDPLQEDELKLWEGSE
jgi:prevent-host-death family protein